MANRGLGYADNATERSNCQTLLNDMRNAYTIVQMRREFTIASPVDTNQHLQLTVDYDDGFIAWLDGVFLTSAGSPNPPAEPSASTTATGNHESSLGSNGNAPLVVPLGAIGSRLEPGPHVLAVVGLNVSSDSSDFIQVIDLSIVDPPNGNGISGPITADTTWHLADSPISVVGDVTVNSGVTLTIEPGVIVRFAQGTRLTVNGRLLAEGTTDQGILFTRANGATSWSGLTINGNASSPETRITYAHFEFNSSTAIHSAAGTVWLEHLTFGNTARQYVSLDDSSFVVKECTFPDATSQFEAVHGTGGIKTGGRGIFLRNFFGAVVQYNDNVDFTGGHRANQPIVQFYNNVFVGTGDDLLDLDGTDAWVEGNIFLKVHKNGSPDSASAISGGDDGNATSEITILRNFIFDCDHAATAKQGNYYTLLNNTIVRITNEGGMDTASAVVGFADEGTAQARGIYLEGNIIADATALVRELVTATAVFTNNFMMLPWTGLGGGNSSADPMLTHIPDPSETTFSNWEDAQVVRDWFSLAPGSPAIGAGPDHRDAGANIPFGVSITGEPDSPTTQTSALLKVGLNRSAFGITSTDWPNGSGYTHYRWRLDGGPWSVEMAINVPIALDNLSPGFHQVEAIGKNDAGLYQNDPVLGSDGTISASKIWMVTEFLAPPLHILSHSSTSVSLGFDALAGASYSVQRRGTLDDSTSWNNLTNVNAEVDGPIMVMDPEPPADHAFYRLVTPAQ